MGGNIFNTYNVLRTVANYYQEDKEPNRKMAKKHKQASYRRGTKMNNSHIK